VLPLLFILFNQNRAKDRIRFAVNLSQIRNVAIFSVPLSVSVLFYWIQSQGYRFILQHRFGLEVLGIFFVTFNVGAQLMLAFETIFNQFYHPIFYEEISSGDKNARIRAWNDYAAAFLPALVLTLLFIASSGALLIKLFGDRYYWPFSYLLFFGALVEGMRIFNSAYSMAAHAEYKTSSLLLPGMAAGMLTIALVYFMPGRHIFLETAAALSLAGAVGLWVLSSEIKKIMPVKFPVVRTLKALVFSVPLFICLWLFYAFSLRGYYWNFAFILLMGGYYLAGQYFLARNWLNESL
jgi:O-antigen/teichoic acid export membrane protein